MSTPTALSFARMWHNQHTNQQEQSSRKMQRATRSLFARYWPLAIILVLQVLLANNQVNAIDLSRLYGHMAAANVQKRGEACHPYEPFKCPGDGNCISIQYLCDGAPDCSDGYDEDMKLCTAAKRPPVEETASFLQSLIASHGPNYLEKLFGSKARDALAPLGGVEKVAIALSESQTIEDFGAALHLMRSDLEHLRSVFMAVENGDLGMLKSLGIKDSELGDVKFFLEKLVNTGFLD
ncbi:IDLSRF-like peptide [Ceratitis capitata]|uniref:IDLSRF-like peptide n=1 Tax=Ceratitis capitata TaxID=7213 RepID=UPI0006188F36|nr:IDLSRF-like peptide [Ceratitis capitata]